MKEISIKIARIVMVFVAVLLCLVGISSRRAEAAELKDEIEVGYFWDEETRNYTIPKNEKITISVKDSINVPAGIDVNMTISDPTVVTAKFQLKRTKKVWKYYLKDLKVKKAGTAKMVVTASQNGKVIDEYSVVLTFESYKKNPVGSLKLGTKDFASAFDTNKVKFDTGAMLGSILAKTQKLTLSKNQKTLKSGIKLKKGYKLKSFTKTSFNKIPKNGIIKLESYEEKEMYLYVDYTVNGEAGKKVHRLVLNVKFKKK